MNVDEKVKAMRRLAETIIRGEGDNMLLEMNKLAEDFMDLDEWLSDGGRLPDEWSDKDRN